MEPRELFRAKLREGFLEFPQCAAELMGETQLALDDLIILLTAGTWFPAGMTRLEWMENAVDLIRATDRQKITELEQCVGLSQGLAVCASVMYGDLRDDFPGVIYNDAASLEACRPE